MPSIFRHSSGSSEKREPWEIDFPPGATPADILACFRLLLGRKPGKEEWPGHSWRVGEELAGVVTSYLNSQEFANRHLLDRSSEQLQLVELAHAKMYVASDDTFVGKIILETGSYEPHVSRVFQEYLRPGMGVLDIGANIGYFSLLAASLVGPTGFVQSWEPSPANVKALCASQLANQFRNIEVVQAAATEKTGLLKYFHNFSNGNVADMANPNPEDVLSAETVMGLRVDDIVAEDARIGFLKIDIEGYEYKALCGARKTLERNRPVITSEFSPASMAASSGVSGREYLEFLVSFGYDVLVLTDDGPVAGNIADALRRFEQRGSDHIDLLLLPVSLKSS